MFYSFLIIAAGVASCFAADSALSAPKPKPMKGCPLEIYLMDKWGDGWNGAKLTVSGGPKAKSFSPKPGPSSTLGTKVNIPLTPLASSVISISNPLSGTPKEYWEVWWSFSLDGQVYVGGYETVITLQCMWKSPTDYVIQVLEVNNAVDNSCSRCQKPKPKPKPAKVITTADGDEVLTWAGSNGETLSLTMSPEEAQAASQQTTTYSQAVANAEFEAQLEEIETESNPAFASSTAESMIPGIVSSVITNIRRNLDLDTPKPKPAPKPAPKKFPYVAMLLNTAGHGWFDGTGVSTYYAISDSTRSELIASGTMCGSFSEQLCELPLPDGDYILRVGGNGDSSKDDNSWEFCGVTGGAQTELSFTVSKGKCSTSSDLKSISDLPKKTKKFDSMDDDTPDIADDDNDHKLLESTSTTVSESTGTYSSSAGVMVFASASIGAFVMGFIAVNAIVFMHLRKAANKKQNAIVSTEITNEKLLAANGLTIIKESDINSSRHKLVTSLDL